MTKSTHVGTCQICQRFQKLPGGVLAKHGYTVKQWSGFIGICPGSGKPPFECDSAVLFNHVMFLHREVQRLLNAAVAVIADATDTITLPVYERSRAYGVKSKTVLHTVRAVAPEQPDRDKYVRASLVTVDTQTEVDDDRYQYATGMFVGSVTPYSRQAVEQTVLTNLRTIRAEQLRKEATSLTPYITMQEDRLYAWKPAELHAAKK